MAQPPPLRVAVNQQMRIRTLGARPAPLQDMYHSILVRPWYQFVLRAFATYVGINLLFALVYWLVPGCLNGANGFEDCFFFSVQTLGTIGYGGITPATRFGNALVTVESFVGILSVALVTGITFAKFARPTARVRFSAKIASTTRNGVPHLMFRMANERQNLVVDATLSVFILVREVTKEGEVMRVPVPLKLLRSSTALFSLTWTAMHAIDESSPFFGGEAALPKLREMNAEIFLGLTALDETFSQNIHARHRYTLDEIAWGCRFADVLDVLPDGTRVIDYRKFDDVVPVPAPAAEAVKAAG